MLNITQVTRDILHWSETFVEVPHPALGNFPPCPFARSARLKRTVGIFVGNDPYHDLEARCAQGMGEYEVIIYAYDPGEWTYNYFHGRLDAANRDFLLANDLLVLEDHPEDKEMVNGICMNQGQYALSILQPLADLNARAQTMEKKGFYHAWPEPYLEQLFQHRTDPRKL